MQDCYIVEGCRTPIGALRGSLSGVRPDDMAAVVLSAALNRSGLPATAVDEVFMGCANQSGEDNRNVARMAVLLAGFPASVPAETVNRLCASGMSAVVHGFRMIRTGDADVVIAGGVESMTRAPWVMSKASVPYGSDSQLYDTTFGWRFVNPRLSDLFGSESMGETAENIAVMMGVSREDQDRFAVWSQAKVTSSYVLGRMQREIVGLEVRRSRSESVFFDRDEFPKPDSSMEGLARLSPAFRKGSGSVTAGNASGLNDGAAAVVLCSSEIVNSYGLSPLVRIVASAASGIEPRIMGLGPVEASRKALAKAGLSLEDMDVIEINEAFAVQVLGCLRSLGLKDDDARVNPNGGAISLGHPLGMSGCRIVYSAALELSIQHKKYALVTMCVGVGQGFSVVLENPSI